MTTRRWWIAALIVAPILVMWFKVVHQDDEILALARNEAVADATGQRVWFGSFVNTNDRALHDVAVSVDFLDSQDHAVGKADASSAEMPFGARLDLQAPLPAAAARIRIHSVEWRMGTKTARMGPFHEPWEFGYLMVEPTTIAH